MRLLEVLHHVVAALMSSAVGAVHLDETELLAGSIVYAITLAPEDTLMTMTSAFAPIP